MRRRLASRPLPEPCTSRRVGGLTLWLALVVGIACGSPSSPEAQRTLARDPSRGASATAVPSIEPLFPEEELSAALDDLSEEREASAAAEVFATWAAENAEDRRAPIAALVAGYAYTEAGQSQDALPHLTRCATENRLFADDCLFWAARAHLALGEPEQAKVAASAVDPDAVNGARAQLVLAEAQAALGELEDAAATLEGLIASDPNAWFRADAELALVDALVGLERIDEAVHRLRQLAARNPDTSTETRALARLEEIAPDAAGPAPEREDTEDEGDHAAETLERAAALFARHRSEQVISLLSSLVAELDPSDSVACEARYLIGKSYTKLRQHGDSVGWYDEIIARCDDEELIVKALYNAGRGYWNIDEDATAIERFRTLWTEYADHSYADDAVLYAARIERSNDRREAYLALLEQQIRDFPDGDMKKDAVWLMMADRYLSGDFRGAVSLADSVAGRSGEDDVYSEGRVAYFRARSLERLGLTTEAAAGYRAVIEQWPLRYYALLSLNRLQSIAPASAAELVADLRAPDDTGTARIAIRSPEIGSDPYFRRGVIWLRLGQVELARRELAAFRARYPADDEVPWVIALVLHRAGAYHASHRFSGDEMPPAFGYPGDQTRERWEIAYPRPFEELVFEHAEQRGLDPWIVYGIMREESGFRPDIESWANARGLLQLMLPTANDMADRLDMGSVTARELFRPRVNVPLGTELMLALSERFAGHPALIISGYNGGVGNVSRWLRERGDQPLDVWIEEIPYSQTRRYAKRVLTTYWIYRWLYGDDHVVALPFELPESG